jgi:hypothetical protein
MIDMDENVGTKVVLTGPDMTDFGISTGTIGVIEAVDDGDSYMTYKVRFPSPGYAVWVSNDRLDVVTSDPADDEPCGWKTRALKTEAELQELKKALKTLAEG